MTRCHIADGPDPRFLSATPAAHLNLSNASTHTACSAVSRHDDDVMLYRPYRFMVHEEQYTSRVNISQPHLCPCQSHNFWTMTNTRTGNFVLHSRQPSDAADLMLGCVPGRLLFRKFQGSRIPHTEQPDENTIERGPKRYHDAEHRSTDMQQLYLATVQTQSYEHACCLCACDDDV